jgi:hypothetical protein
MTTYRLPLGRGRKFMSGMPAAADHILGGWTVSTISYLSSGFFFSPGFSGSDPSNTNTIGGLPDRIGNGNLPSSERSYTRWFDPSAFRTPQAGLFGNSAPNVLVGQGINAHHLGLAKRFAITEKLSTTFTAQVSDIFNTPHFNEPSGNISVPNTVGRFTSVVSDFGAEKHNGRRIALMLRVEF